MSIARSISMLGSAVLLSSAIVVMQSGCGGPAASPPEFQGPVEPSLQPVLGMRSTEASTGRVLIFDGANWVPHDETVDAFYQELDSRRVSPSIRALVSTAGPVYCGVAGKPPCEAPVDPAHAPHAAYLFRDADGWCNQCHVGYSLDWFGQALDPVTGLRRPAYIAPTPANPSPPPPVFNGWSWSRPVSGIYSCSSVACHGVPAGTFSYYFPDGSGEAALNTVEFGGTYVETPIWGSTGSSCTACHGNPPMTGSNGSNIWHSGRHAGGPTAASNQCQFCHPSASGTGGRGTTITNPALHGNGRVEVQVRFKSSCFGCH
jgi:hypothetical protein